jgi:hypothetical protein
VVTFLPISHKRLIEGYLFSLWDLKDTWPGTWRKAMFHVL